MWCAMAGGMKSTAVFAIAVSMPDLLMMPVNTPAASRMLAIISAALAWASTRWRC